MKRHNLCQFQVGSNANHVKCEISLHLINGQTIAFLFSTSNDE